MINTYTESWNILWVTKSPQGIEFTYNEYGRPFVKNSNINFSISHSYNMVSYIVVLIGIDIENCMIIIWIFKNRF